MDHGETEYMDSLDLRESMLIRYSSALNVPLTLALSPQRVERGIVRGSPHSCKPRPSLRTPLHMDPKAPHCVSDFPNSDNS
jgi:hypothetical protein